MARRKLFADAKQDPTRIYRSPCDVLRDRRFSDEERLEILRAWRDIQADQDEITTMIVELEGRDTASEHAAE